MASNDGRSHGKAADRSAVSRKDTRCSIGGFLFSTKVQTENDQIDHDDDPAPIPDRIRFGSRYVARR